MKRAITVIVCLVVGLAVFAGSGYSPTFVYSLSTGTTPPASTPGKVGDLYIDTTHKRLWYAVGTGSSADWILSQGATGSAIYRDTVATGAQTQHVLGHTALQTTIVNRGPGTLWLLFSAGTIDKGATNFKMVSGESLQNVIIPWGTIEMLAETDTADVEILVAY